MTVITRGWPPSRRKRQAERIRALRPWLRSTGPRTPVGKARSRMNALRHGMCSRTMRRIKHLMHRQRIFLKLSSPQVQPRRSVAKAGGTQAGIRHHKFGAKRRPCLLDPRSALLRCASSLAGDDNVML